MYSLCLEGMACSLSNRLARGPASGSGDDDVDGLREPVPVGGFLFELAPAGLSQGIELGLAAGFAFGPVGGDPPLLLEAVQGGIERALLDLQDFVARLSKALDQDYPAPEVTLP